MAKGEKLEIDLKNDTEIPDNIRDAFTYGETNEIRDWMKIRYPFVALVKRYDLKGTPGGDEYKATVVYIRKHSAEM